MAQFKLAYGSFVVSLWSETFELLWLLFFVVLNVIARLFMGKQLKYQQEIVGVADI